MWFSFWGLCTFSTAKIWVSRQTPPYCGTRRAKTVTWRCLNVWLFCRLVLTTVPPHPNYFRFPLNQGAPTQEAGPGSSDPAMPQVYAPPPTYPPQGQGPSASVGRLPPLDFSSTHAASDYAEHPQLRVYQGPQLEGAEALTSSSTVGAASQNKTWSVVRLEWEGAPPQQGAIGETRPDRVSFYI